MGVPQPPSVNSWIRQWRCLRPQEKKWNEWGLRSPLCRYRLNWPRRTGCEIRALAFWGRASYLSCKIINLFKWARKKHFVFFETWRPEWVSNPRSPTFQAGSFNHCIRAPAVTLRSLTLLWGRCVHGGPNLNEHSVKISFLPGWNVAQWERIFPAINLARALSTHGYWCIGIRPHLLTQRGVWFTCRKLNQVVGALWVPPCILSENNFTRFK